MLWQMFTGAYMQRVSFLAVAFCLTTLTACGSATTGEGEGEERPTEDDEICDDGEDNDNDDRIDCADRDCGDDPACVEGGEGEPNEGEGEPNEGEGEPNEGEGEPNEGEGEGEPVGEGEGEPVGEGEGEPVGEGEGEPVGEGEGEPACTDGDVRCQGAFIQVCANGSFATEVNCTELDASAFCSEDQGTFGCVSPPGETCFNGELLGSCGPFICAISSATVGICTGDTCNDADIGTCTGQIFTNECTVPEALTINCAGLGSSCVENVGCVADAGDVCVTGLSGCADGATVAACPDSGLCPAPFVDTDASSRATPTAVTLPSSTVFGLTARDEDCVSFTVTTTTELTVAATVPADGCNAAPQGADPIDPAVFLLNSQGQVIAENDDGTDSLCAAVTVEVPAGTYRACVIESPFGGRAALSDVTLAVSATIPPVTEAIVLPFQRTFATLSSIQQCFTFTVAQPANVAVDVGGTDPRCIAADFASIDLDTKFTIDDLPEQDDQGDDRCAAATETLAAGPHIVCVSAFDETETNVATTISIVP
jgi:hypothetical protein